ncbi:hypothetical protein HX787_01510 [Pseudomonas tolaasii]|uniref:Outer membrane protein assembly factor BamE n=2 Tax=Pseudomonas tolaasii TaxID=29442 RepID=A0A7Y8AI32_PSETO|nr:hypothetical protein [Pseudomonas tolaasii]ARB30561.1 hypothetical protein B5P22_25790 [Pseudomonas tolaasii]KAB0468837.1 hypothetical protein F7R12_22515 [Pseudomonas tolaasii]MBW1249249.1 hypothetical protein [Pseudomonas tolaasii]MBY8941872.1 hypothetical protein [Pseudomonas tolaasii]NVZ45768.1 hypothetical protein [Pseudomonas tolaasii]
MARRTLTATLATALLLTGCANGVNGLSSLNNLSLPGIQGKPGPDISLFDTTYVRTHIISGKTTSQQLKAMYGEPQDQTISSDGIETWSYTPSTTQNASMRHLLGLVSNRIPGNTYDNAIDTRRTAIDNIAPQQQNRHLNIHLNNGVVRDYTIL